MGPDTAAIASPRDAAVPARRNLPAAVVTNVAAGARVALRAVRDVVRRSEGVENSRTGVASCFSQRFWIGI